MGAVNIHDQSFNAFYEALHVSIAIALDPKPLTCSEHESADVVDAHVGSSKELPKPVASADIRNVRRPMMFRS